MYMYMHLCEYKCIIRAHINRTKIIDHALQNVTTKQ